MALFVVLKNVKHDGESYVCGDVIEKINKSDSDRLKEMGVIKEVNSKNSDEPPVKKQKEKQPPKKSTN